MKKSQIVFHSDGYGRRKNPAVNVKVYSHPVTSEMVKTRFRCSTVTAEKAMEYAWESGCEHFWEQAQELADHYLGRGEVYSESRSNGWLVVRKLPEVESWDAIMLGKWSRFVKAVNENVRYFTSRELVFEMIESNEWAKADSLLDSPEAEALETAHWAARDTVTIG